MVASALYPTRALRATDEQRIVLANVSWATYVMLRDSLDASGSSSVRMTYLTGQLEIMSPSHQREVDKKQIARFLELFCLERDIPLFAYGSTTFRNEEAERGLEPDECYSRGVEKSVPDFAIEVIASHGSLDKLEVYRGLGVREVWVHEAGSFRILSLQGDRYASITSSITLPEIDLVQLASFVQRRDQHAALKAFRDDLRAFAGQH